MAVYQYGHAAEYLLRGYFGDLASAGVTVKFALVTSSYTFDADGHDAWADISGEVAAGNGYSSGGYTLTSKAVSYNTSVNRGIFTAANAQWTVGSGQTLTARGGICYLYNATPANAYLLTYFDFESDKVTSNDTFVVAPDSSYGYFYIQA